MDNKSLILLNIKIMKIFVPRQDYCIGNKKNILASSLTHFKKIYLFLMVWCILVSREIVLK